MSRDPFVRSRAGDVNLPAVRTSSSEHLGWTSALVRTYREAPRTDEINRPPLDNPQLILVTGGVYRVESRRAGVWRQSVYRAGSIGLTPPEAGNTLRWRALSEEPMTSVHVHIAADVWDDVTTQATASGRGHRFPDAFVERDPLVCELVRALQWAAAASAPKLYADTTVALLSTHLSLRRPDESASAPGRPSGLSAKAVDEVISYMQERLGDDLTLEALADVVGLSRFHFLRQFKIATGLTPFAFLNRLRMQRAAILLSHHRHSIEWIAYACGYRSASRFAAAFRRHHGVSPTRYREAR